RLLPKVSFDRYQQPDRRSRLAENRGWVGALECQTLEGAPMATPSWHPNATEPLQLDHTGHPAADRFTLAHASDRHVHALRLAWDDVGGKSNAHYAPFSWRSA